MKTSLKILLSTAFFLFIFAGAQAQKNKDDDHDAVITVKVNGKEQDLDDFFEEWGEELGDKIERMFDDGNINVNIDDDDFNVNFNSNFDFDDLGEAIATAVTQAITNMNIELSNIDPHDFNNNINFDNDDELDDLIEEIEDKYNSDVENIDHMKIKIREDYVKVELDMTLENGKKVSVSRILED